MVNLKEVTRMLRYYNEGNTELEYITKEIERLGL
jgi:hypothetical protein